VQGEHRERRENVTNILSQNQKDRHHRESITNLLSKSLLTPLPPFLIPLFPPFLIPLFLSLISNFNRARSIFSSVQPTGSPPPRSVSPARFNNSRADDFSKSDYHKVYLYFILFCYAIIFFTYQFYRNSTVSTHHLCHLPL
jgi:hypothetical protein